MNPSKKIYSIKHNILNPLFYKIKNPIKKQNLEEKSLNNHKLKSKSKQRSPISSNDNSFNNSFVIKSNKKEKKSKINSFILNNKNDLSFNKINSSRIIRNIIIKLPSKIKLIKKKGLSKIILIIKIQKK